MTLPVLAEMTIGGSIDLKMTVKDSEGVVQETPTIEVLVQLDQETPDVPTSLSVNNELAVFTPTDVGDWKVSVRVTDPVDVVREGVVIVHPSAIT